MVWNTVEVTVSPRKEAVLCWEAVRPHQNQQITDCFSQNHCDFHNHTIILVGIL